jgi:hypothetical protein
VLSQHPCGLREAESASYTAGIGLLDALLLVVGPPVTADGDLSEAEAMALLALESIPERGVI